MFVIIALSLAKLWLYRNPKTCFTFFFHFLKCFQTGTTKVFNWQRLHHLRRKPLVKENHLLSTTGFFAHSLWSFRTDTPLKGFPTTSGQSLRPSVLLGSMFWFPQAWLLNLGLCILVHRAITRLKVCRQSYIIFLSIHLFTTPWTKPTSFDGQNVLPV